MSYLNKVNGYKPTGQINSELKENFMVVTICGSMRFYDLMLKKAEELTADGCIVLMPFVAKNEHVDASMLDAMHRQKMDMADLIVFIVGQDRYMGDSTRAELDYAHERHMNYDVVAQ